MTQGIYQLTWSIHSFLYNKKIINSLVKNAKKLVIWSWMFVEQFYTSSAPDKLQGIYFSGKLHICDVSVQPDYKDNCRAMLQLSNKGRRVAAQ